MYPAICDGDPDEDPLFHTNAAPIDQTTEGLPSVSSSCCRVPPTLRGNLQSFWILARLLTQ